MGIGADLSPQSSPGDSNLVTGKSGKMPLWHGNGEVEKVKSVGTGAGEEILLVGTVLFVSEGFIVTREKRGGMTVEETQSQELATLGKGKEINHISFVNISVPGYKKGVER